jgi:hypothetical protein
VSELEKKPPPSELEIDASGGVFAAAEPDGTMLSSTIPTDSFESMSISSRIC